MNNKQLFRFLPFFVTATICVVAVDQNTRAEEPGTKSASLPALAPLPDGIASFGAAIDGDWLYVYGGHLGKTHTYSKQQSSARFQRINLKTGGDWQELPSGSGLQGLVLLAHGGQLYRIGGMTAKNEPGEKDDLYSSADFARFDPKSKTWTELVALPEARSSHGATFLGNHLYVVGGWRLHGAGQEPKWMTDALVIDLTAEKPEWKSLSPPPFERRAMSATAFDGKIYVTGGLMSKGGISQEVDVFDTKSGQWSKGPAIPGMPMNGNGLAACSTDKGLFLSGMDGKVYRLNNASDGWDPTGKLSQARIHHRLLPIREGLGVAVAGATMAGNLKTVDAVELDTTAK